MGIENAIGSVASVNKEQRWDEEAQPCQRCQDLSCHVRTVCSLAKLWELCGVGASKYAPLAKAASPAPHNAGRHRRSKTSLLRWRVNQALVLKYFQGASFSGALRILAFAIPSSLSAR